MTPKSWVMKMMDVPFSSCSSFISRRIWAWMVTSRAVVGSSAMRILGRQARAMAIITRWRMPPDSWWGYWLSTASGLGICTARSISRLFSAACFLFMPWWTIKGSDSWRLTVNTGFRLVMGSWKMTEIALPRMWYISSMGSLVRSLPSKMISPESI